MSLVEKVKSLPKELNDWSIRQVIACLDNDDAGLKMTQQLKNHLNSIRFSVKTPKNKDWNDDLILGTFRVPKIAEALDVSKKGVVATTPKVNHNSNYHDSTQFLQVPTAISCRIAQN